MILINKLASCIVLFALSLINCRKTAELQIFFCSVYFLRCLGYPIFFSPFKLHLICQLKLIDLSPSVSEELM